MSEQIYTHQRDEAHAALEAQWAEAVLRRRAQQAANGGHDGLPNCPHCGDDDVGLLPSDFETGKCHGCGRTFDAKKLMGKDWPSPDTVRAYSDDQPRDDHGRWTERNAAVIASPEFKRWFGNSKVVGPDGKPLVVYHSTSVPEDFPAFKRRRNDIGIHFGTLGQAQDRMDYLDSIGHPKGAAERIIPVYLSIKNPVRVNDAGSWDADNLGWLLKQAGLVDDEYGTVKEMREALERRGYDGIVYKNEGETAGAAALENKQRDLLHSLIESQRRRGKPVNGYDAEDRATPEYKAWQDAWAKSAAYRQGHAEDSWIAFHPEQIKSAIGNRGKFNPRNKDITAFNPDQERVPAGSPEGGEFTSEGGPPWQHSKDEWIDSRPGDKERYAEISRIVDIPTDKMTPADMDRLSTLMDARRKDEKKWERSVSEAVSLGKLAPEEAHKRGWYEAGLPGWAPLPATLYHVTTAKDAVLKSGALKSRDELGQDFGAGLGGGPSDTISFTDSLDTAKAIAAAERMAIDVASGKITAKDLLDSARRGDGADHPWLHDIVRSGTASCAGERDLGHDELSRDLKLLLEGRERVDFMDKEAPFGYGLPSEVPAGWRHEDEGLVGSDGQTRYSRWTKPLTPEREVDHRINLFKTWLFWREHAGGPMDPLFFLADQQAMARRSKDQIAIVKVTPVPGAMGTHQGALGEWRTYTGKAVKVALNDVQAYSEDQARDDRGRWVESGPWSERNAALVASPEFKRWFTGSKVVDKDGAPLVAFHGTTKDVREFQTRLNRDHPSRNPYYGGELGSWFSAPSLSGFSYDPGNAEFVAEERGMLPHEIDEYKPGTNVMPVYLSIKNPMEYSDHEELTEDAQTTGGWKDLRARLVEQGHDGVVVRDTDTDGNVYRDDWVAFEPEQIKSAIGNRGSFDPRSKDVTAAFDPDQPRDESGRWTDDGGGWTGDAREDIGNEEDPDRIRAALKHYGAEPVTIAGKVHEGLFTVGDNIVEWDGKEKYPSVTEKAEWIENVEPTDYYPEAEDRFNEDFWSSPPPLFHATPDENAEEIERDGLTPQHKSRGISNRGIQSAVFTTTEPSEAASGSYGDTVFRIDTAAMKRDGLTHFVGQEPTETEADLRQGLASAIGLDDYEPNRQDWEGYSPYTVVLYGPVPAKYLTKMDRADVELRGVALVRRGDWVFRAYAEDQPRDERGRWTEGGGAGKADAQYAEHVKAGRLDAAGGMVVEAANNAGYTEHVFHGTTHEFTSFDPEKINPENQWGRGFHFTSSEDDANANYAGVGPDLTNRIEQRAEQIFGELPEQPEWNTPEYKEAMNKARAQAREQLAGKVEKVLNVGVKLEHPAVIGGEGETYLEMEYPTTKNEDGEEEPDYDQEPTGSLADFVEGLREAANEFNDTKPDEAVATVQENFMDGAPLGKVIDKLRTDESIVYATDDEGHLVIGELLRKALENAGYDGIIDRTVNEKFGTGAKYNPMAGMDEDTYHVIAFHPEQVKSLDTVTHDDTGAVIPLSKRFNPQSDDLRAYSEDQPRDERGRWADVNAGLREAFHLIHERRTAIANQPRQHFTREDLIRHWQEDARAGIEGRYAGTEAHMREAHYDDPNASPHDEIDHAVVVMRHGEFDDVLRDHALSLDGIEPFEPEDIREGGKGVFALPAKPTAEVQAVEQRIREAQHAMVEKHGIETIIGAKTGARTPYHDSTELQLAVHGTLAALPKALLEKLRGEHWRIWVNDETTETFTVGGKQFSYGGACDYFSHRLDIYGADQPVENALAHELGHAAVGALGDRPGMMQAFSEFHDATAAERGGISNYARQWHDDKNRGSGFAVIPGGYLTPFTNADNENFAELFEAYVTGAVHGVQITGHDADGHIIFLTGDKALTALSEHSAPGSGPTHPGGFPRTVAAFRTLLHMLDEPWVERKQAT